MKKLFAAALTLGMSVTGTCLADNWYIGVGAGQSTYKDWASTQDMFDMLDEVAHELDAVAMNATVSASVDDNETGWKLFAGYRFSENIALEVSYLDFGNASAKAGANGDFLISGVPVSGAVAIGEKMETTAFAIDTVAHLPVASWVTLFGKLGLYRADTDYTIRASASDGAGSAALREKESDNNINLHFGIGADFAVTDTVSIRTEWERLRNVEIAEFESDIDLISVSAIYRF